MQYNPRQRERLDFWIKSLKSGDYRQSCSGDLCFMGSDGFVAYCCLGVAQEIFDIDSEDDDHVYLNSDQCVHNLGLSYEQQQQLASMNDGKDKVGNLSFDQIADVLQWCLDNNEVPTSHELAPKFPIT